MSLSVAPAIAFEGVQETPGDVVSALTFEAGAIYDLLPGDGRVDVAFSYEFRNGSVATEFPGFFESLPGNATDVTAEADGRVLAVAPVAVFDDVSTWFVSFATPLQPDETVRLTLHWSVLSTGTEGSLASPGVVAIDVFVPGVDSSQLAVQFTAPAGYRSIEGLASERNGDDGFFTLLSQPYEVRRFHFTDPNLFDETTVDLPPEATLSYWAADPAWSAEVSERAEEIASDLERWFGARTEAFTVERTFATDVHPAIDADFVALADNRATSIDHQLAHVWLADVAVEEPWFIEGLALGFAGDAGEAGSPEAMIAGLVDDLGANGVRAVVDALRAESSPYAGATPETRVGSADWRLLLDLIEEVGGVDDAAAGFRATVVNEVGAASIDRRAAARIDYEALELRAGSWALPRFLRVAMESWDFETFSERQTEVSDEIATRDSLAGWTEALELEPRNDGEALFESSIDDLVMLVELHSAQAEALEAFDEAERVVNGDRGLLAKVGLWGSDPDEELLALRQAWADGDDETVAHDAHELAELVEGAVGRGTIRLLVPALILLAVFLGVRFVWRSVAATKTDSTESALVEDL